MLTHPSTDYSGGPFARPSSGASYADRASLLPSATLTGQDSVSVGALSGGLSLYAGYIYGTYNNWAQLTARFGGSAQLVSITPVVQVAVPAMCLDVEPGDASPGDCPAFQRLANHGGAVKPIYYTSAGDLQAVINALAAAGYQRSDYFLWSAHWSGLHICGPSTCGYPQADATQYASNSNFDSDVFSAYMFTGFGPPPVAEPVLREGSTGAAVITLRELLDAYHAHLPANADGAHDAFGPVVLAAVKAFQKANGLADDGVVGNGTWTILLSGKAKPIPAPPAPEKQAPLALSGAAQFRYLVNVNREIAGYKGIYFTKVASHGWAKSTSSGLGVISVEVPVPGTYTVTTQAAGFLPTVKLVTVPAAP